MALKTGCADDFCPEVRLQRECSDDELLELWTLALRAMELKNGPQVGCGGKEAGRCWVGWLVGR